ncbi:MAG: hypothetical protein JST89_18865 [Cyanobacteria bacterium SZAS-4]|nr:hypothetical protein [Cyanobacteria bacterium SZAS-4]
MLLKPRNLRMKMFGLLVLSALYSTAFAARAFAATASTELQQGIASYNASDHPRAVSLLHMHLSKNQNDAVAHYYLANSLLKLGQQDKANVEYRKAYELSKDPTLRQYCVQALQKAAAGQKVAAEQSEPRELTKEESDVAKSLERIKRQSETAKDNKIRNGAADAKDKLVRGNHDVRQLEAERDMKIHNLLQPDAYSITGNPIYLDHTADIEAVKRDYANRIKEAQILAKEEASVKNAEVAKEASTMLADVDNLRSQLTDTHHLPGTPPLQATGTNFYTRQYGDPRSSSVRKPAPPVDELLATPEKMILDSHTKDGGNKYRIVKDPMMAEQDKLKNHSPGTDLKVKGTLIRK